MSPCQFTLYNTYWFFFFFNKSPVPCQSSHQLLTRLLQFPTDRQPNMLHEFYTANQNAVISMSLKLVQKLLWAGKVCCNQDQTYKQSEILKSGKKEETGMNRRATNRIKQINVYVWEITSERFDIITNLLVPAHKPQQKRKGRMECWSNLCVDKWPCVHLHRLDVYVCKV